MPKKKSNLPVFVVVEMPKWKNKIIHLVTKALFPKEKYFVVTIKETGITSNGKSKYTDEKTGLTVDLSN